MNTAPAFAGLDIPLPDAVLALIGQHAADNRPHKIDIGVGVYRNASGATPVMEAVKAAEQRLVREQVSKSYLGADGNRRYVETLEALIFGENASEPRRVGLQTPGGTGALRLGAEMLARASPGTRSWLSAPTWPNHAPIFAAAGLATCAYPYFDPLSGALAFDAMIETLRDASPGDVVLLHGCCHNPTGTAFSLEQWQLLAALCNARGLIPFVDMAYHGLGEGLEEDVRGVRYITTAVPNALLAYSCDKNFGLYRERVGALWVQAASTAVAGRVRAILLSLSRSLWSMPPDHGAAIVRLILDDPVLAQQWRAELLAMRTRIDAMRRALAAELPHLANIARQHGLFSLLPIGPDNVRRLRDDHGIYMADNGRINVAGLNPHNLPLFVSALRPYLSGNHDAAPTRGRPARPGT